ncbi:FAD-dependent oxidoreductase [Leptospira sp. 2 VSF19]|uniref:FAD-dependent oxidoreductase n=1 Tax=Leptospira soteropolitanensis TaxID=2950025 RepID=A0AAW5VQY4_9LEPT|nr:NAD(P)/FAD-dependent oxidoreductase [Leptospira soteropolitanensis]MCW7494449.1 FAD-dependent oxidoreductase [Leptospira soteropolitanensis]MCW7502043.1 FAD-dependent oxidoreductase [Leptospira soteropolitanensis]MCW7524295.1 FAD-dependent oxidoreductase [Leptospira soteropolitanensis]MCW7528160.1 FAD-dependent oxidoreductase [Leptospira soteropolitanensis]MCW7532013.1 FAD-dependent oxidoreductase [Leptospira soteropolitanensis]
MNRKRFLQKISAVTLGAGLILPKKSFGQTTTTTIAETKPKSSAGKKAIVLGGGLSGLYSAYLLKQTGYDVTIIERGDRLGGRIATYENPDLGIIQDLGGEWIGDGQSDIKSLVKQLNLDLVTTNISDRFSIQKSNSDLLKISKSSIETLDKVIDLHKSLGSTQKQGLDKINFSSYARYQGLTEEEIRSMNDLYRVILGADLNQISSESVLDDLSALQSALKPKFQVRGGAERIIKELANLLKNQDILLGETVTKVSQQKNQVTVDLSSGRTLKGSLIVCALPAAAVLDIKWTPGLPKDLIYSGLRMQTGKISKNLSFVKPKLSLSNFFLSTNTAAETFYVSEAAIGPNITAITSISTGDRASLFEKGSDRQKKNLMTSSLEELGDMELVLESPFFFHSFQKTTGRSGFVSLFPPGSFGIKDVWAEPFERVFFAGEHLAFHTGSMDSAVASAIQAVSKT